MRRPRVLFVCIGNACRSQMAEAFARTYGASVVEPASAGLSPAGWISPITALLMLEKNITLESQFSKGLDQVGTDFDLIVNMSAESFPVSGSVPVREWVVEDPIGLPFAEHRAIRDQIELLVRGLLAELQSAAKASSAAKD